MVYSAQLDSYENCDEVPEKCNDIKLSASRVWRVANAYGEEVGKTISEEIVLTPRKKEEAICGMADRSTVFASKKREVCLSVDREVKVGRIFKTSSCIHAGDKPGWIGNSRYFSCPVGREKFAAETGKPLDYYTQCDMK